MCLVHANLLNDEFRRREAVGAKRQVKTSIYSPHSPSIIIIEGLSEPECWIVISLISSFSSAITLVALIEAELPCVLPNLISDLHRDMEGRRKPLPLVFPSALRKQVQTYTYLLQ